MTCERYGHPLICLFVLKKETIPLEEACKKCDEFYGFDKKKEERAK